MQRRVPRTDYAALSELLAALAYPARLELLDVLRDPLALAEIRIGAHQVSASGSDERSAAKQTVAKHLQRLMASGLVRVEDSSSGGRRMPIYSVVPSKLYALIEELRGLSVLTVPTQGMDLTGTIVAPPRPRPVEGPHFVLVHGVYEGKHFPLDPSVDATVGREPACTVRLDYDPYVSSVNSHVEATTKGFLLADDPRSKNGTSLNWIPLARGERLLLQSGDLVGVGRSRLLFLDRKGASG